MKKIVLSAVAVFAMSSFAVAGGDIAPVDVPVIDVPVVDADAGFYVGLAYGMLDATFDATTTDNEVTAAHQTLGLIAGYKFNSYVAIEGRDNMSLSEGEWEDAVTGVFPDDTDDKVVAMSVFVKPMYPVTNELDVYALLGYASTTYTTGTANNAALISNAGLLMGNEQDVVAEGFAYGVGIAYDVTDSVAVFVDYVSMYNADAPEFNEIEQLRDTTIASINAGVTYKF